MYRSWTALLLTAASAAAVAAVWPASPARAGAPDVAAQGRVLYQVYCRNCHGLEGRGDGPTAKLMTVRPADLTGIARRNGGEFPRETVRQVIDGREPLPGHGRRNMPIWGLSMQQLDSDVNQEDEVRAKIDLLVRYLASIQQPRTPARP